MRIIQINTVYKRNSTGRTCWEVEKALVNQGHMCLTFHQQGPHDTRDYIVNNKLGYYIHKLLSRLIGLDGYFSRSSTRRVIKIMDEYSPDIIHLRNLHGAYLNLPVLFEYLGSLDIPIVYNIHDTWAYTGKCPEYDNVQCSKWMKECFDCPQYKRYPKSWFFDRSRKIFNDKKKWYGKLKNLTIVGVSDYMKREALKSPLFCERRVERIYNWIDLDSFCPRIDLDRSKYGIGDGFTVIGVSSWWKKNTEYDEMCKLAKLLLNEAQVVMVGGESLKLPYSNMIHIPFTESTDELAELYSLADAFVCLSTAESFGKVAAEALACGTPTVVYDSTGISEIPGEECGFAVLKHDLNAVKDSLMIIKKKGKGFYADKCRNRAESEFSYIKNSNQLISLYEELVE